MTLAVVNVFMLFHVRHFTVISGLHQSLQCSSPGLIWCRVQALQDHETVINVIRAVVAVTEKFSEVTWMKSIAPVHHSLPVVSRVVDSEPCRLLQTSSGCEARGRQEVCSHTWSWDVSAISSPLLVIQLVSLVVVCAVCSMANQGDVELTYWACKQP